MCKKSYRLESFRGIVMNKKKIAWLAVGIWMAFIFYLSHQPSGASSELSSGLLDFIIYPVEKILSPLPVDYAILHFLFRKAAHFFAYFLLGVLVFNALHISEVEFSQAFLIAFIICVFYAISDEVHQLYIPGRSGEIRDVVIDSIGSAVGILSYTGCLKLFHRKR